MCKKEIKSKITLLRTHTASIRKLVSDLEKTNLKKAMFKSWSRNNINSIMSLSRDLDEQIDRLQGNIKLEAQDNGKNL